MITSGTEGPTATASASVVARSSAGGFVVGRDAELAEMRAGLEDARRGRGTIFAVTGEPGIGKTRLAEAIADEAAANGALVLWGACWEGGGAPAYWPWIQIVRALAETRDDGQLAEELGPYAARVAQMIPELARRLPDVEPPTDTESEWARFALFDAIATFLSNASHSDPLLIVVDDIHVADHSTILLLEFLARSLVGTQILGVVTYRPVEMHARVDAASAMGNLARYLKPVLLRGIDRDHVSEFVEALVGRPATEGVVEALQRTTEGNPFFMTEMLRLLQAEGHLSGSARLPARLPLPDGVREVIRRRLDPLPAGVRELLTVAAVIGREFRVDTLADATDRDRGDVVAALDEAVRTGMAAEIPGRVGRYEFSHALVMEAIHEDLSTPRRAELHRRVGEALERRYSASPDRHLAELAHHFVAASALGEAEKAFDYARRAGDRAMSVLAYEEAVALYGEALRALELVAHDPGVRVDMMLALGAAQTRAADLRGMRATFIAAAGLARSVGDARRFAMAALGLGSLGFSPAVDEEMIALLEEALTLLDDRPTRLRARVVARLAVALHWSRFDDRRAELVTAAEEMAGSLTDPAAALRILGQIHLATMGPDQADRVPEMRRLAAELDDPELDLMCTSFAISSRLERNDIAGARRDVEAFAGAAHASQQPRWIWYAELYSAIADQMDGRFQAAARHRQAALRMGARVPGTLVEATTVAHLILERWLQGRLPELEDRVRDYADELPLMLTWRSTLTKLLADAGRETEARVELDLLAQDRFRRIPRNAIWFACMTLLAEAVAKLGDAERARDLYALLEPYAERNAILATGGFIGPVHRFLGLLARTHGDHDKAVEHFEHARARALEWGMRPILVHIDIDMARARLARGAPGDREAAAALAADAHAVAHDLDMGPIADQAAALESEAGGVAQRRDGGGPGAARTAAAGATVAQAGPATASLTRDGDVWTISLEDRSVRVVDSKGVHYLAMLLRNPGVEIHAIDLVGGPSAGGATGAAAAGAVGAAEAGLDVRAAGEGDTGPVLDAEAKRAYKLRLDELRDELEEAEAFNDPERAARAREEIEFLGRELAGAVGLGGRDRKTGSDAERARVNVTRALRTLLKRIAEHDPALGRELETTIRTGTFCAHEPDPRRPVSWTVIGA